MRLSSLIRKNNEHNNWSYNIISTCLNRKNSFVTTFKRTHTAIYFSDCKIKLMHTPILLVRIQVQHFIFLWHYLLFMFNSYSIEYIVRDLKSEFSWGQFISYFPQRKIAVHIPFKKICGTIFKSLNEEHNLSIEIWITKINRKRIEYL